MYIGNYTLLGTGGVSFHRSLKYLSLPTYLLNAIYGNTSFQGTLISHVNNPSIASDSGNTFNACTSLRKYVMKSGVTTFTSGGSHLLGCNALSELKLPATVTSIGIQAYQNCLGITQYIFLSTTPPTLANVNAFTGINPICKIYVPDASVAAYKAATNWSFYANYIYPLSSKPQSDE